MAARSALSIERLTVRSDRIICDVALAPDAPRFATPRLASRIRAAFPDVARHACVNDEGDTFAAVMDHTSLPHVLEHLVISLQVRAADEAATMRGMDWDVGAATWSSAEDRSSAAAPRAAGEAVFVGTTEWANEASGRARIEVSFTDDLVALRAFRDAVRFLNDAVVTCAP